MAKQDIKPIYSTTYKHKRTGRRRRWLWILLLIFLIASGVTGWHFWKLHQTEALQQYPIRGISVSQQDGFVDFQGVQKAGMKFAYLKSTSGTTYFDDNFTANYDRIQGADLKVGVYLVFSFDKSADAQAKYFIKKVGHKVGNLPIAIQVSYYGNYADNPPNSAKQGKKLRALTRELANYYASPCIVWTSSTISKKMITPYLSDSRQWLVVDSLTKLSKLKLNKQTEFVQYSNAADLKVSGQKTSFATSVFTGKKQTWQEIN
ncbi:GH25 family lysozyme [Pediococcus ethanolidurans]|uniref:Lysozyme n=1 Tax=Pediococcus ethanolidurans TaxID=319653 RepID=A0A1H9QLJ9_9LACO|nr:GH25 family lysozyme [Pediococcus ethanolidurans]GEN95268.1 lysozyme [Pediococcus ethanolidurans]SER61290.1 lysozyme [Pediococcus ethanolidurans]